MTIISISIPDSLLEKVDRSVKQQGFANRSEIIRQSLRAYMTEDENLRDLEGEIAATLTLIYERKAKKQQISEIQHHYGSVISTFLHSHINEDHCLEVIVVKGKAQAIREMIDAFRTIEEIIQIKIAVLKESQ